MIMAAGFWENKPWVYKTPRAVKDRIRLWNFTMKAFGVKHLILIDVDQNAPEYHDEEITFEVQDSLESVLDAHKQAKIVFLSQAASVPQGSHDLAKFEHPKGDVLYVVGSDYGQLDFDALAKAGYLDGNYVVSIDTPVDVPLWSHVALAIALYDRQVKCGADGSL